MENRKILVYTSDVDQYNNYNKIQMNQLSPDIQSLLKSTKNLIYNYYRNNQQETIERIQSDWNQNNVVAIDYIKNKPIIPNRLSQMINDCNFVSLSQISDNIDLSSVFAEVSYDSANHRINFYGQGDLNHQIVLGYIDTTPFIIDGMVDSVTLLNGILTIIFNTDSGKEPITIPLGDIFNVNNYYTKTDIESLLSTKYTKPQTGIPKIHLSQEVQDILNSVGDTNGTVTNIKVDTTIYEPTNGTVDLSTPLSNKVDKETGKGLSSNDYTTAEKTKLQNLPTNPVTQQQMEEAIQEAAIEAIVGSGDFAMTYDAVNHIYNIVRLVPTLAVTSLDAMSEDTKSGTFKVSGTNLKGNVTIATTATNWSLSVNGGTASQSITLQPTDGVLAETTITVAYSGSTDSTGTITVSSTGAESKTVAASYSEHSGPTITVDPATLSFAAIGGQSQTKTATVGKFNIDGEVSVAVSGTDAGKFSASLSGSTLSVTYTPGNINSGNHTATITLSASGATDKTLSVSGSVLAQSLTINPVSLNFSGAAGTATSAKQIVLTGTNLFNDVTVTPPSTGFTVTRNGNAVSTIAKEDVMASGGVTLDVVAAGTTASGSIGFSSGLASVSAPLSWTETETDNVGDVVTRVHGYASANAATPTIGIKYKIIKKAGENGSTTNEVKVVNNAATAQNSGVGYINGKEAYTGLHHYEIPLSIDINGTDYDVTEVGGGAFYGIGSLVKVSFALDPVSGKTNVKRLLNEASVGGAVPYINNCNSYKGTNGDGEIHIPEGVTTVQGSIVQNNYITSTIIGNDVTSIGDLSGSARENLTYLDYGQGVSYFKWIFGFPSLNALVLRYNGVVSTSGSPYISNYYNSENKLKVYVPDTLVSTYETSTAANPNWKSFVDNGNVEFHAISELNN